MNISKSKLIVLAHEFVHFDEDQQLLLVGEWQKLDVRVKWFLASLGQFRMDVLDGQAVTVTSILGLDSPRKYHKDGAASDMRTRDMSRAVRKRLRSYSFSLRDHVNSASKEEGWKFGFDPHDSYEKHDPAWRNEHFHIFVKTV